MNPQEAFALLKPASVRVAREGSVESVRALRQGVEQVAHAEDAAEGLVSASCITHLKEYLLFPLIVLLKSGKKCSWDLQEEIVGVVHVILGRSIIDDFTFFQEIFTQLIFIVTDKTDPQKVGKISEECKETAMAGVSLLIQNSVDSVKQKVYSNSFKPQLGHAIYISLKLMQEEKNRSLKIQAMETLLVLGQKKLFDILSNQQQDILSSTFANFLPGIVTALTKVATGDEKQGHKVTAVAVDAWSYFVVLVMRDNFLEKHVDGLGEGETVAQLQKQLFGEKGHETGKEKQLTSTESNKFALPEPGEEILTSAEQILTIDITREWVCSTADKLILLVQSLTRLVTYSHWRVRLSLVHWAQQLICKCCRSLTGAVILGVEVIVGLRSDDIVDVGTAAQEALLAVTQALEVKGKYTSSKQGLLELLEERVYALSTQLPTVCRQQDGTKTLTSVRQLLGCLEVLGERITRLMSWPNHSHRLLQSLSIALTLDTMDSDLLLERTDAHDPFELLTIKPSLGKSFKYFQDVRIFEVIGTVCQLIGCHSNLTVVVDLCLDFLQHSTFLQKETLLMLSLIIQGRDERKLKGKERSSTPHEESEQVVHNVLDVIMCKEIFSAPLCVLTQHDAHPNTTEDLGASLVPVNKQNNISIDFVKSNVVLVANALNLLSSCAQMMGTNFDIFLSKVLCSVMEKAGEANVLVGHTAINTLQEMAQSCGYENVAKFIENSVPQFWYPLSMRLKKLPQYPTAPLVLQVSLEYANIDVISFTEELVEDVLACLDTYHNEQALPLVRVLHVYVTAVVKHESKAEVISKDFETSNVNICLNNTVNIGQSETKQKEAFQHSTAYVKRGPIALFLENYHKDQMTVKKGIKESDYIIETEHVQGSCGENFQKHNSQQDKDDEVSEDSPDQSEEKREIPRYIELVVDILERCSHLLYFQDRKIKILVMKVIKAGCSALSQWEDQRLPVLHKLWKPLVLRLKDPDFVVMVGALEVLSTMVITSGDFLRQRTLKGVFPSLLSFLQSQSRTSLEKTKRSGYYMTAAYRAQKVLLRTLPNFVRILTLDVTEMAKFVNVLMLYLDNRQPIELCNAGIVLVKQLAQSHPHHVWLALAHQQSPVRILPPTPNLSSVKINGTGRKELPQEVIELYNQLS
ncbi:TELO2-interacting protein 1 homolog isoform X1 [Procambarus clarkii]|uniref:TELO2-interacting protein 1 homolog isoform X1 n=2 Tax=Procambarus clarkii TaxID=6728 RepID=UPI0037449F0B